MHGEPPHDCKLCPRLHGFLSNLKGSHPSYYNAPVPSFGDPQAKFLIVGLAPGMHGANQTGRPFTGDWAGDLLYAALSAYGFSKGTYKAKPDDGLLLIDTQITNAVRCLPPANKPLSQEVNTCRSFLADKISRMSNLKAVLTLGKIAHDSTVKAFEKRLKDFPFGHGNIYDVSDSCTLFSSYHCSRYNTNTKRLTQDMFYNVFADIRTHLDR